MLSILLITAFAGFAQAYIVHIDQGTLNGTTLSSRNGDKVYGFYGIPYAQSPTGALRFQSPKVPPPSWEGIKSATQKPPYCPQVERSFGHSALKVDHSQSEDCLYLQVFTKNPNATALRPVLVWFHGGGFFEGSSTLYEPTFLMDKPIVMVGVNYRLGVLGFLSAGEASYPGNYGLKDQSAALKWIQKNIRAFGGDPSAVTIMGHSAGSASVHLHTLSPLSKGTFHRGILESGTANAMISASSPDRAKKSFQSFSQQANCSRSSTSETVACLLTLSSEELLKCASTFPVVDPNALRFNPAIEPYGNEGAFLPVNPRKFAYLDSQIPLIFGFTSNERVNIFQKDPTPILRMNCTDEKAFDEQLLAKLNYNPKRDHDSLGKKTLALVKKMYFGNNFSHCDYNTTTLLRSDMDFKFAVLESISTYPSRSYAYEYDYRDMSSPLQRKYGVGHGGELRLIIPYTAAKPLNDVDTKFSEKMVTYWTNFVLTGNPNTPDEVPAEWTPAKTSTDDYHRLMYFSNNGFQMWNTSFVEQAKLWTYYSKIFWG